MSRIALISDIHGNLNALSKVTIELTKEKPDIWICLGDIVGYGPNPGECIQFIQEREMLCVKGNHDAGVTGEISIKHFRNPNKRLIELTKSLLNKEQLSWLKSLPLIIEQDNWIAAHASPIEPEKWKYIESAFIARDILGRINSKFCFTGHTHKPALVADSFGINKFVNGYNYLINPGSVGQSRDGDYRASCAIVDIKNWVYKNIRVEYDMEPVLTSLMKLGFTRGESNHMMKT